MWFYYEKFRQIIQRTEKEAWNVCTFEQWSVVSLHDEIRNGTRSFEKKSNKTTEKINCKESS